jgi:hypothetical protein
MAPSTVRVLLAIAGTVLLAGALYSALWTVSSTSLAFVACDGKYSLFAESFRCRQPYIAGLLAVVLFAASIWAMYVRARIGRKL